ncbi:MAG: hypothetical protein RR853_09255, partial [Aurantimicrobium sp.]|uniref:hypothetical protein n=1 Tax=Aurantimicrobium sp. TaxID=1930784 RepID=UPI002FCA567B
RRSMTMANNRYTVYVRWVELNEMEEIDVDASNSEEALSLAKAELDADYLPGYEIVAWNRREGLYV